MAGNPPGARQGRDETWRRGAGWGSVRSGVGSWQGLDQEDPLEKGMATHSIILAFGSLHSPGP